MIRKKLRTALFVLTGVCMLAGAATVYADVPNDLWEYTMETDSAGNITYQFKDVEITLPASWSGKCGMSISDTSISFYHLASREAHLNDTGSNGGRLLSVVYSQDYSFTSDLPNYTIIGSGSDGVYYYTEPTDVQGYTNDSSIWSEWLDVYDDVDWVEDHIAMINVSENTTAADLDVNSLASSVSNVSADGYIVPDSSSRVLSTSDLSGLSAAQLQMAINEIYARNHRRFDTPSIQAYFDSKSWYSGTINASDFNPASMSETEWANISLMLSLMGSSSGSTGTGSSSTVGTESNVQIISGGSSVQVVDDGSSNAPIISSSSTGFSVRYTTADVNMRAQAVSGSTIVAVVMEGVGVTVTGDTVNGWVPVSCSGYSGYIYQDYLR